VISLFSAALAGGRGITVHGDGSQTRDFIYVSDIVRFLRAGMHHAGTESGAVVLNACTGRETSVRMLAETLGTLLQMDPVIASGPARAGDVRRSVGSPARAASLLGLEARTMLADGLETTLNGLAMLVRA
jgi:UDP-glucose 4-epimerase